MISLALVGLPGALVSYRERGVLRRLEAFGISTSKVVAAQAKRRMATSCGKTARLSA
jgi:ABC-2 type transport system permease protein